MTSAITSTCPPRLKIEALPPAPTFTVTWLAMVWAALKLRFETVGGVAPDGYTDRKEDDEAPVTVTLSTTASAFDGTPPTPATVTSRVTPAPHGVE